MKILVCTYWTKCSQVWAEIGALTSKNKSAYCQQHGYFFLLTSDPPIFGKHTGWYKMEMIAENLRNYDAIFWTDADAIFTNFLIPLERYINTNKCFIVPEGSGDFFVINHRKTYKILDEIFKKTECYNSGCYEQDALFKTLKENEEFRKLTDFNTIYKFNPPLHKWQEGDFILHLGEPERINKLKSLKKFLSRNFEVKLFYNE